MADRLKKRSGKQLFVLPNYPTKNFLHQKPAVSIQLPPSTLIYIGGLNRQRNIHGLVRVLSIIRHKYNIDATLAIFGNGSADYIQYVRKIACEFGVNDSVIMGYLSGIDIPHLLCQAKVGLFLLKADDPSHQWGEPIKFFEYAAAGLPVIFSDLPAKRNLIETFENGFVVDPDDEEKAAQLCIRLLTDENLRRKMGKNGKMMFEKKYNWESLTDEIQRLLEFVEDKINQE